MTRLLLLRYWESCVYPPRGSRGWNLVPNLGQVHRISNDTHQKLVVVRMPPSASNCYLAECITVPCACRQRSGFRLHSWKLRQLFNVLFMSNIHYEFILSEEVEPTRTRWSLGRKEMEYGTSNDRRSKYRESKGVRSWDG